MHSQLVYVQNQFTSNRPIIVVTIDSIYVPTYYGQFQKNNLFFFVLLLIFFLLHMSLLRNYYILLFFGWNRHGLLGFIFISSSLFVFLSLKFLFSNILEVLRTICSFYFSSSCIFFFMPQNYVVFESSTRDL